MDNLLFYVFLALVSGLVWLHFNRGNTDKINALKRKAKSATGIKLVEIALLLCAGAMGSFFAYQLLSPISVPLAIVAAVLVIFFNMAEGYILRSTVNSFRHSNILVGGIGVISVLMLMLYSLTAGSSVIETFLNKHNDIKKYYQYEELASKQRIEGAQAQVLAAQLKARESDKYGYLNSESVANAQANASTLSANEYSRMAQLMKDKAPDLKIAFGFDHESIAFLMALVLELSIVGIVVYQVLYVSNDALLSAVRYENKTLGWNVNPHHTANLSLEGSPAPDVVALPYLMPNLAYAVKPNPIHSLPESLPSTVQVHPELIDKPQGKDKDKPQDDDIDLAKDLIINAIKIGKLKDKASFPLVTQLLKEGGVNRSNEYRQKVADVALGELISEGFITLNKAYDSLNPKNGAVKYLVRSPISAFSLEKGSRHLAGEGA